MEPVEQLKQLLDLSRGRKNLSQQQPGLRPAAALTAIERATVARRAIRRALVDLGFLLARRTMN